VGAKWELRRSQGDKSKKLAFLIEGRWQSEGLTEGFNKNKKITYF